MTQTTAMIPTTATSPARSEVLSWVRQQLEWERLLEGLRAPRADRAAGVPTNADGAPTEEHAA